jgi:hypothetical protein
MSVIDLPCNYVTTWEYNGSCSSHTALLFNETGNQVYSFTFQEFNATYCLLSFNYTAEGSYFGLSDMGDTFNIQIIGDENMTININYVLIFLVLLWAVFLWLSFSMRIPAFLIITSLLTIGIGISLYFILPAIAMLNFIISFIIVLVGILFMAYAFFKPSRG